MATKHQPQDAAEVRDADQLLYPVDELQKRKKIATPVFCGVCAQNNWRPGKTITEAEFNMAVSLFLKGGGVSATGR